MSCLKCEYLEYYSADTEEFCSSGYSCNGRDYKNRKEEKKHLRQLDNDDYLRRPKKCCTPKQDEGK